MIGRFSPPGIDHHEVPAFFDTGDAAALERWKQQHPDWFVAGTWSPPRRRADPMIEDRDRFPPAGRRPGEPDAWTDRTDLGRMDPASLSVADFQAVAAAARAEAANGSGFIKVQARTPRRPARGPGTMPERSPRDEAFEVRYGSALRVIRDNEPSNPMGQVLRDPARPVPENVVLEAEAEAHRVLARAARVPAGPSEADPATPSQRRNLRAAMIRDEKMVPESPNQAHHIVPGGKPASGGRDAGRAQEILKKYNIELDGSINGVGLSRRFHAKLHTKEYYEYVNRRLQLINSPQEIISFLRGLANRLQQDDARFQRDERMPSWQE